MLRALRELRQPLLEALDPLIDLLHTVPVFGKNQALSRVVELKSLEPLPISDRARTDTSRRADPQPQQELCESMPGTKPIFDSVLSRAHHIAQRLVLRIRNPGRGEVPASQQTR